MASSAAAPRAGGLSGTAMLSELEASAALAQVRYKDASNVALDVGLCVAFDAAPLDPAAYTRNREAALLQSARENAQLLVRAFFELPAAEDALYGPTAALPARSTALPREKPVPAPAPPTRWEKFAKEKGILKKGKRERMLFDEPSGEYKPRFGYKRGRDESSEWCYELKGNDKGALFFLQGGAGWQPLGSRSLPGSTRSYPSPLFYIPSPAGDVDHLERRELEKNRRVVHNKTNQATNLERAALESERRGGFSGSSALFSSAAAAAAAAPQRRGGKKGGREPAFAPGPRLPAGIPSIPIAEGRADVLAGPGKHARPKPSDTKGVKTAQIGMAQVSTASMGKVRRTAAASGARRASSLPPPRLAPGQALTRHYAPLPSRPAV